MLIEEKTEMTERERIAVRNSNNQYLKSLSYVAVGTIFPFSGATAPDTFMFCDGSSLDTTEYAELFNVIGYTYGGSGDNFNLPDLRGRTLIGAGTVEYTDENTKETKTNTYNAGESGGEAEHTLTENELPPTPLTSDLYKYNSVLMGHTVYQDASASELGFAPANGFVGGDTYRRTQTIKTAGGNEPHNNMPPYLVCNYIMKVCQGIPEIELRLPIDQTYNPESENAQSGKAVAEAISKIPTGGGGSADQSYISYKIEYGRALAYVTDKKKISGDIVLPELHNGYYVDMSANCFKDCPLITSVKFPRITCITNSFENCTSLKSIIIPSNVSVIYNGIFKNCPALTDIYYEGTQEEWLSIDNMCTDENFTKATVHYNSFTGILDTIPYIFFKDGNFVMLKDNCICKSSEKITNIVIQYPDNTHFIGSIIFTLADEGDITITLPESKYIGGAPTFTNGETWELNIMNGVVVGGKVE